MRCAPIAPSLSPWRSVLAASLYERLLAEVLAVEVQQIKGVQDDAVGSDSHSRLKRLEVRTAIAIR